MATTISGSSGVTYPSGGVGNPAGAVVGTTDTQTLTNKTIQGGAITSGTSQASTSGTSIDFTGIPSWVKRITVMFNGVSTNAAGSAFLLLQLGSGSVQTTGYTSYAGGFNSSNQTATVASTAGMAVTSGTGNTSTHTGSVVLASFGSNVWVASGSGGGLDGASANIARSNGGTVTLSGALDRIRITTSNGTDTFDAGSINILYE